jgi:hypothetical protein
MFKHPTPEDFFRTMEDASGVDLDWFWRGWFFGTDPVDISIENVKYYKIDTRTPSQKKADEKAAFDLDENYLSRIRNAKDIQTTYVERDTTLVDFYNRFDRFEVFEDDIEAYEKQKERLTPKEKELRDKDYHFYEMSFKNIGGLVMPVIVGFEFADGTIDIRHLPAEIWRLNEEEFTKVFAFGQEVVRFHLDPLRETADIDESNNHWPRQQILNRFEQFKAGGGRRGAIQGDNPMKKAAKRKAAKED